MLKVFHIAFITVSTLLAAGTGAWGLVNGRPLFGMLCLAVGAVLVIYQNRFLAKARQLGL